MKQSELMPLEKGLAFELGRLDRSRIRLDRSISDRMDEYLRKNGIC